MYYFVYFHNYLFIYIIYLKICSYCPDFVDNNTTIVLYVYLTCFSDKPVYL